MGQPNDHGQHGEVRYRFFADDNIAMARLILYDSWNKTKANVFCNRKNSLIRVGIRNFHNATPLLKLKEGTMGNVLSLISELKAEYVPTSPWWQIFVRAKGFDQCAYQRNVPTREIALDIGCQRNMVFKWTWNYRENFDDVRRKVGSRRPWKTTVAQDARLHSKWSAQYPSQHYKNLNTL